MLELNRAIRAETVPVIPRDLDAKRKAAEVVFHSYESIISGANNS